MKRLILWIGVLAAFNSFASAWFKNKIVQNKYADVSVTIMRWGVPDDDMSTVSEDKQDRLVGQVASDKYQTVTLVFESSANDGKFLRLSLTTGVHVFTAERNPYCTLCPRGRRDGYGGGVNAKGAKASGGCFFELFMPRQQDLRKLRLVDVLADGQSVYYFTKFNVSCDLLKSPARVPVSKKATLHPVECSLKTVDVDASSADIEKSRVAEVLGKEVVEQGSGVPDVPRFVMEDITPTLSGGTKQTSGIILKNNRVTSMHSYAPPLEIEYVCKTDSSNIRLAYGCDQLIFNWERNLDELRIDGGPVSRQHRRGAGRVPVNEFITIRQVVEKDKMDVFVDEELRASWKADFSSVNSPIGVFSALGSTVTVKSIKVRKLKE